MPHLRRHRGKTDQYELDFGRPGHVSYSTAFEHQEGIVMQYGLDDAEINKQLNALVPPALADLIDIAVAVYISDRLAVRGGTDHSSMWHRSMNVLVPVRRIDLWRRTDIQRRLAEVLGFLTEDEWRLQFRQRPMHFRRLAESQEQLFADQTFGPIHVGLLSGGLDSFIGTAAAIADDPRAHYVCVSGVANRRQGDRQKQQVRRLRDLRPSSLTHVRVACWLKDADEIHQEPTRRTRGFLFLALGAVAAIAARVNCVWLYENGIGAVNLPFASADLGVTTSRSVHPEMLGLMSEFVSQIVDQEFSIRNGVVLLTKAQMCADLRVAAVLDAIPLTFSCDAFPLRRQGATQCGVCTSCLLRRMALCNARLGHFDVGDYRYDLCGAPLEPVRDRHLRGVREMGWQVARITAALAQQNPWQALVSEFPSILSAQEALVRQLGSSGPLVAERLIDLYRSHILEWCRFPAAASARMGRKAA